MENEKGLFDDLIAEIKAMPPIDVKAESEKALERLRQDPEYIKLEQEVEYLKTVDRIFRGELRQTEKDKDTESP